MEVEHHHFSFQVSEFADKLVRDMVRIILQIDRTGIAVPELQAVLVFLHDLDANILTVNQSIPVDGAAAVNISLRLTEQSEAQLNTLNSITGLDGVLEVKLLSAE